MTNYLQSSNQTYQSLQSFNSIDEMNQTVKQHKQLVSSKKHKNIYRVLDLVSQYSCVHFGVSWLSINRISDLLGIAYKTAQRALDKLVALNIITKYACKRESADRRQTSNIYVINPIKIECDQPQVSNQKAPLLNSKSNNTSDTEKADLSKDATKQDLIKKGLVTKLPSTLQQALAPFFDADKLYKFVGIVYKAKASVDKNVQIEDNEQDYYNAIVSTINAFKRGKVRNLEGLLYYAIKSATHKISRKNLYGLI